MHALQCRIAALPFEEAAFDLVILHHLVADGGEEYLAEALRVLAAGGDIVISGLNSSGLRNRIVNRKTAVPALKLNRICKFLKSQSFNIEQCLLMGLGGFSRPAPKSHLAWPWVCHLPTGWCYMHIISPILPMPVFCASGN